MRSSLIPMEMVLWKQMSVFKVASKVHIQSGPFSFFFEHRYGDSGLEMVFPIFETHYDLPSNIRRATSSEAKRLEEEISDLPKTLPLFLNKLRRIMVTRSDAKGRGA